MAWFDMMRDLCDARILDILGEEDATYFPNVGAGPSVPLRCHFKRDYDQADIGVANIAGSRPQIMFRLDDVAFTPVERDKVVVRGVTYYVTSISPNGQGAVVLFLQQRKAA